MAAAAAVAAGSALMATPSGVETTTQPVAQQPPVRSIWTEVRPFRYLLGVPDSHGAMLFMVLVTVPYAFLTPRLLRSAAGQPTAFVCTIAILATSYFFIGAIRFTVTLSFPAIFFRISYVALLSVAATHFIGSTSGAAVATLLTFYAARIFGHTIGEYVHRAESEAMVDYTPPSGFIKDQKQQSVCKENGTLHQSVGKEEEDQKEESKSKEEDQRQQRSGCKADQLEEPVMCFLFVHGIMSLFVLMRMVWLVLIPGSVVFAVGTEDDQATEALMVVNELSLETLYLAWPWGSYVAMILQEQTVFTAETMIYKVGASIAALYILSIVLSIALGEAYGLLVLWLTTMAMVGLYGYITGMFARYDHICASLSQVQHPMEQKVIDDPEATVIDETEATVIDEPEANVPACKLVNEA